MKKKISILMVLIMLFGLAGCVGNSVVNVSADDDTWTVLVYLCGTDLESEYYLATSNLEAMKKVGSTENVNIIVQTGGTKKWGSNNISTDKTQRWKVGKKDLELVDTQPLTSMGEADTLGDFLKWGVEKYPADKYMTLLWDHGGGSVSGIVQDELFEKDTLDLKELTAGVAKAGVQFEVIGFDACLMATIETASALSPYAKYMVASEELEPGGGWNYKKWLTYLVKNPNTDGLELGKVICDTFYKKCKMMFQGANATLSVIDLREIPSLVSSVDAMAVGMKESFVEAEKVQKIVQAAYKSESYGANNRQEGYTNMIDLGNLIEYTETTLPTESKEAMKELNEVVKYKVAGKRRQRANGLSIYFPINTASEEFKEYAKNAAFSGEYLRFLEALVFVKLPGDLLITRPVESASKDQTPTAQQYELGTTKSVIDVVNRDVKIEFATVLNDDGNFMIDIKSGAEYLAKASFLLWHEEDIKNAKDVKEKADEEKEVYSKGPMRLLGVNYDIKSNEEKTQFSDNFKGKWATINGNLCTMIALEETEEYVTYTVPVIVNGEATHLRIVYDRKKEKYEVLGTWAGLDQDTGMSSRDVVQLKKGDKVELTFISISPEKIEGYAFEEGEFVVNGKVKVEDKMLPDGTYYYQYELADIFNNVYQSQYATVTIENGEIYMELE